MKCFDCGVELIKIGDVLPDEIADLNYYQSKMNSANDALNPEIVNKFSLSNKQMYDYFKSAFDSMAEGQFLFYTLLREVTDRINKENGTSYKYGELNINEYGVYIHPAQKVN